MDLNENKADLDRAGYVYVVSSECIRVKAGRGRDFEMPYKIGSAKDVDERIGILNSSVPVNFRVWWIIKSKDRYGLESAIHEKLDDWRYPKGEKTTEFFVCKLDKIKEAVKGVIKEKRKQFGPIKIITKWAHCGRSAVAARGNRERLYSGETKFICSNRGTHAIGWYVEGGKKFVVEKGARCSLTPTASFATSKPVSNVECRNELLANGKIDAEGVLQESVVFTSPSQAAAVITAASQNGNDIWREYSGEGKDEGSQLSFFLTGHKPHKQAN